MFSLLLFRGYDVRRRRYPRSILGTGRRLRLISITSKQPFLLAADARWRRRILLINLFQSQFDTDDGFFQLDYFDC